MASSPSRQVIVIAESAPVQYTYIRLWPTVPHTQLWIWLIQPYYDLLHFCFDLYSIAAYPTATVKFCRQVPDVKLKV